MTSKAKSNGETIHLTIGEVAKRASVNSQTLRYYERKGILCPDARTLSGYRTYRPETVRKLKFIKEAQDLGFTLSEIKELLGFRISTPQQCAKVRSKAERKLKLVQDKLQQLRNLERTLDRLIVACGKRDISADCPIIQRMEDA
jgi:Hg(II)-responsive transcriptional regulator